jgi:hypothetical protein
MSRRRGRATAQRIQQSIVEMTDQNLARRQAVKSD